MPLKINGVVFNVDALKMAKRKEKFMDYGTSGFRARAEDLNHVVYRTGMLATLRSMALKGQTIGMMITASHNPDCDNGIKMIDPSGEMMEPKWESYATSLINAEDEDVEKVLQKIVDEENIDINGGASIFLGQDTRESSPHLSEMAIKGVTAMRGTTLHTGFCTTPALHYTVFCANQYNRIPSDEKDYNLKLTRPFLMLNNNDMKNSRYTPDVIVDAANGVGALKMKELRKDLQEILEIELHNYGNGTLNYKCGADFVKVYQTIPEGIPEDSYARCVSLDGDADRLVYFYIDAHKKIHLLDGDKIATLIASYIMELVQNSELDVKLGLVQTAYANGNSTDYITNELKVPVACVPTGVKHLHHKAKEFDIGVYFEANGHGTVVYSERAEQKIRSVAESEGDETEQIKAARRLMYLMKMTNQTVGDAIADMLIVETILKAKDWCLYDWEKSYTDLPNRLMKVTIKDRKVIETTDAERVCTKPEGLQEEIDKLVSKYTKGRSFVRPSGTEDVVRVYAEASTQDDADELAAAVASTVHRMAGGVGSPPAL